MQPKKQLKVQYIGIFEEIDSFYSPKMHFLKKGQKIRAWVDPPPTFGQCLKENVFFSLGPSLINNLCTVPKNQNPFLIEFIFTIGADPVHRSQPRPLTISDASVNISA